MSIDSETPANSREDIINSAIPQEELARLSDDIVGALKTVYDPEIPADIYELGLIYKIDIEDDRSVNIVMTLTAPGCPVAGEMPGWVQNAVSSVEGVSHVDVEMSLIRRGPRTACPKRHRSPSAGIEADTRRALVALMSPGTLTRFL